MVSARPPRRGPLLPRIELALAAFAPAYFLVALRSGDEWWAWVFYSLAGAGVLVLAVGGFLVATGNTEQFELTEIEDASDQVVGYIAAYIVPVIIDPSASAMNAIIAAAALFLVFVVHIATGRVHINPLLYLIGYRVYTATTETASFAIVARSEVADWVGERALVDLSSSVLVEKWRWKRT